MNSLLYLPRDPEISHHVRQLISSVVTGVSLFSGLLPRNDIRPGSTIPAFGRDVTILILYGNEDNIFFIKISIM
jgi:hypothetical protein